MINLKGVLFATSNINLIDRALLNGDRVIYVGDPISAPEQYKDRIIISSILTPDYQTLSLLVDGNENGFIQMYTASLMSRSATEMFSVIMGALYYGVNVVFYFPQEASGLNYHQTLLEFIWYNYGIQTQTKSTNFSFNTQFSDRILELLYLNNIINSREFLLSTDSIDDSSMRKLVNDIRPCVDNCGDINMLVKWFSNYKNNLLSSDKPLINGIQYAGEMGDYACY